MLLDCCVKLINCSPTQTGAAQPVALPTLGKTVVQCEMHVLFMPPLKKTVCMQTLNKLKSPEVRLLGLNMKQTYLISNISFISLKRHD